jgi:hypothetical protein
MVEMVISMEGKRGMKPDIREDLQTAVSEWDTLTAPPILDAAADYVRKMHAEPFAAYHSRLRRLTAGGGVALDAGSGTATWSIPMADMFDRVIAIDKNRPRVDFARWWIDRCGTARIEVSCDDVTALDLPEDSVDFVFCYGVVISYLSLRSVLREFRRVARPGAPVYVCLNGIGWSRHLRDERGAQSATARIQGQRGFYNTFCQTQQAGANDRVSRLLALAARDDAEAGRLAQAAGLTSDDLTAFFASCREAKTLAEIVLPGANGTSGVSARRLAGTLDNLFGAAGLGGRSLVSTLTDIERECEAEYADQFGLDLVNLVSGRRDEFSYSTAGRGYTPEEAEAICRELGLTDFRWAGDGELIGYDGEDVPAPKFFPSSCDGQLGVWEFMVKRP